MDAGQQTLDIGKDDSRRSMQRLVRAFRKVTRAWDVDFYERDGVRSIAVLGTEADVKKWAQKRAAARGVKRWIYHPFPEFNDRYDDTFKIANCPSWVLVRPNVPDVGRRQPALLPSDGLPPSPPSSCSASSNR